MQQSKTVKKTLTSTKNPVILIVDGQATAGIQVIGTYTGTLQFEASLDGINWSSILFKVPSTGVESSSTTSTGIFVGSVAGLNAIRVRASALASGTPVVTIVTSASGGPSTGSTSGNVASGATDSGNPVKVGGKYNASAPTLADGQRGDLQLDANGNTKVTLATALGGLSNGVENDTILVAPFRRADAFQAILTSADASTAAQIKSGTSAKSIYITDIVVSTDTAMNVKIQDNAGTPVVAFGPLYLPANSVWSKSLETPYKVATAADLNFKASVSGNISCAVTGYVI